MIPGEDGSLVCRSEIGSAFGFITAFLALLLIRIEDLGGWDAVNDLISHAIDDESARKWK
jgi:hypothetical protein